MRDSVLITGARAPVAQDLARAMRGAGYDVHLADSVPAFAARYMRPRYHVHRLPPPRQAFAEFRRAMLALIEQTGAAHIIPTCEEVFWLAEAARLDGYAERVFAPPLPLLRTLHSKADFPAFAASLGIEVPETRVLSAPITANDGPAPLSQWVLKPEFSRFATHSLVGPSVSDLDRVRPTPTARWVVQERLRGAEICSYAAVHRGVVTAFAAYRPRWRQGQAAAFLFEAVDSAPLRQITETIAAATGMSGHLSFDAIVTDDGRTMPIECNPRAVSGLHLFDASADLAHAVATGTVCAEPPAGRLRHLGPAMAFLGLPTALRQGRVRELRADWRQSRDVIRRGDGGLVTLGCIADAAAFAVQAVRAARSPAGATTADIEWDGEAMA